MNKNIKKSLKFLIIFAGIILILPSVLFVILRIPTVQTFVVKRITDHISTEIQSTISLGKIEYDFFNTLSISNLLIKDQHNDTLIYSDELDVSIRKISLRARSFRFGKIVLTKPVISLLTDSTGKMNISWYLEMLKPPDDTVKKSKLRIIIDHIALDDARFSFTNQSGKESRTPADFNNLKMAGLNGDIQEFIFQGDSTSFEINNLMFHESSGFRVNEMSGRVVIAQESLKFNSLSINSGASNLKFQRIELNPDSINLFKNFADEVKLDIVFEKSLIRSSDLKYFVPMPERINESVWLSGRFFGTVAELRGRNIELSYRENTSLNFDFDITGLTNIDNAFIYIDVTDLRTNAADIEKLDVGEGKIRIPDFLYEIGNISFDGSFTGFTTDFVTYGKLSTNRGNIRMDLSLRPEESRFRINGLISGSQIDLGTITENKERFGKVSMEAHIDGYASSLENFAANLTGKVDSIEIDRYTYRNIELIGYFTEKMWDGKINIEEENIKMELLGMFNFRGEFPEVDFSLNLREANLHKLNFDLKDSTASINMLLTANFIGDNIDNLDGEIKLINSSMKKYGNTLDMKGFSLKTFKENGKPVISLRTDFADADIKGDYSFSGLAEMVKSTMASLLPSIYDIPEFKETKGINNFTFNVEFKNTDKINNFFKTGLSFSDDTFVSGIIAPDSVVTLTAKAGTFIFRNNTFKDLSVDAYVSKSTISADVNTSSLEFMGQTDLKGFGFDLDATPDNFIFSFQWDNLEKILNKGRFAARGTFSRSLIENGNPVLNLRIDSSDIYVRNNLWKVNESEVVIDSNSVKIDNIYIANNSYFYQIDGSVSENPQDTLRLNFRGIDISPLNYIGKKKKPEGAVTIPLNLSGRLNGNILLTNIYKSPLVESNIRINDLSLLDNEYGDMALISEWDAREKVININASNNLDGIRMLDAQGFYDPLLKEFDLEIKTDRLPIGALNPLLKVFASDISGLATGKARLSGAFNRLNLTGAIFARNASLKIDYLQTVYKLSDTIRFDNKGIRFNNVRLTDIYGNPATLTGYVYHKNLKDYRADLSVNTTRTMVLNTRARDNDLFYGTAFATGVTTVETSPSTLSFDISARTEGITKFYIPLTSGLSVSDYSFITFIDSGNTDTLNLSPAKTSAVQTPTGIDMNIDLEITPAAEVKLIFDAKVGDEMTGVGTGDLNINLDRKGNFKISGDYIIEKGDYLFTLGNILNKPFDVERGGRITFNGDIDNAEIDIKAIYGLTTSLYELLGKDEKYKERTDVECHLNLTGNLFNPTVKLNIELPNADEETRTYLRSMINTDEELNRQFFSLLVMNSFMATTATTSGTSAMAVTTFEMLSNQLSNMLSQISNDFDLGINYRPGSKSVNSQELEVALSTQLLDDKVLVNIRGTSSTEANTNSISGDFDAEIKITEKIRFKVFNRYNNPYTGKLADYTQGIGLFYRQEFDKFPDLFRKKEKSDMKKEEETGVKK